jgi:2-methylcitrate dehydratase PrpD
VLAIIALHGRAGLAEFDAHYQDPAVAAFRGKVRMLADAEVEAAYRGGASEEEMRRVIALVWGMAEAERVPVFLG